jgi:hypothetical protein
MPYFIISKGTEQLADRDALAAYFSQNHLPLDKFIIEGQQVTVTLRAEVSKGTNGTPPTPRAPTDTAARDALDAKVLAFLDSRANLSPSTLKEVAAGAGITLGEATPALQRLLKAKKIAHPGTNRWAGIAKPTAGDEKAAT